MRLQRLLPIVLVIAGLAAGLAWCVGPCCSAMGTEASAPSIGAASCCGAGTPSRCQPSIQRADTADVSSVAVAPSPLVLLSSPVTIDTTLTAADFPTSRTSLLVPRQAFSALHTPLLI